jgi:hypothetical protein
LPAAECATHLEYTRRLNGYPQPEHFVDAVTLLGAKVIELHGHQGSVAIEQQRRLSELIDARQLVVKTAAIEEAIDEWTPTTLRRAQSWHSATILAFEGGLSLSRSTPMLSS